jgi:hypothetical protein
VELDVLATIYAFCTPFVGVVQVYQIIGHAPHASASGGDVRGTKVTMSRRVRGTVSDRPDPREVDRLLLLRLLRLHPAFRHPPLSSTTVQPPPPLHGSHFHMVLGIQFIAVPLEHLLSFGGS